MYADSCTPRKSLAFGEHKKILNVKHVLASTWRGCQSNICNERSNYCLLLLACCTIPPHIAVHQRGRVTIGTKQDCSLRASSKRSRKTREVLLVVVLSGLRQFHTTVSMTIYMTLSLSLMFGREFRTGCRTQRRRRSNAEGRRKRRHRSGC